MMRPRWYKVLADLWGNRTRSTLVIASIAVGLFAIGIIVTLQFTLQRDMTIGYAAVNPANIEMSVLNVDDALVNLAEGVDGVASAEAARVFSLRVKDSSGQWVTLSFNAFPDLRNKKINRVKLVAGKWPPRTRQVVLDEYKFGKLGIPIGGMLTVELADGSTRMLQVTGEIKDQTIGASGSAGGFFMAPAQGYITSETLGWLGQGGSYNRLYLTVSSQPDDESHIRQVANRARKTIEKNGGVVISQSVRASDSHPNLTYTSAISSVLFVLSALVVFLSGFLTTNTFQALLNQQINQIGIMKTIGGRSSQIFTIYMALIFIFGLVAFAVSLPLANLASISLLNFLAGAINMETQEFRTVPQTVIVMLLLALIVPQVSGFFPILQGVRISVHEATSGIRLGSGAGHPGRLEHRLLRVRRLPRPLLVSLRNTFRRRGRLALTLITLSLGGAIFIATFNVRISLDDYINRVGKYFLADINLTLGRPYHVREIQTLLEAIPEVGRVEGWSGANAEILDESGFVIDSAGILAPPAGSALVQPIVLQGRWVEAGDLNAIAISEQFSEALPGIQPGDMLRLRINGRDTRWTVVGLFQFAGKASGYLAYTTFENLNQVLGSSNQTSLFRVAARQTGLTLEEQKALGDKIEKYLKSRGYTVRETAAGLSLNEEATTGLNVLTTFLLIMAILTALVGSIGLAGTMTLNVMERTREIGILRAIGASDRQVTQMVMTEGILIGLLSWLAGFLISFPITRLLSDSIFTALFNASWRSSFTPTGALIWLGLVVILSVAASLFPARSAARLTIREVLAYE